MKSPISLYFHIPFCTKKCPYCHFYVVPDKQEYKDLLLDSLKLEWKMRAQEVEGKEIISVYFGGGTPFLFGPKAIQEILPPCSGEVTLEANPENVTVEKMRAFKEAGINRVSIGVQSLDDSSLSLLGRNHLAQAATQAILDTYEAGIENISIDLMYDLPGQTLVSWENTLKKLETLPITHLSLYNLTIEPHTVFFKYQKTLKFPDSETSLKMLEMATQSLETLGLKRYEISAFAKPGYEAIHNSGYWTARPFLGFGPSAFSYWEKKRFRNIANLHKYARLLQEGKLPVDFEECLPYPNNLLELFAVELRLLRGINLSSFEKNHGNLPLDFPSKLHSLKAKGWLSLSPEIRLTPEGLLFYDSVATELL